jgi:energy-coupling factor transporter ATP-binding protein EcfA2
MTSILFVLDSEVISALEPGTIAISPSKDSWNDFGFRIRVDIAFCIRPGTGGQLLVSGFFGFVQSADREYDVRLLEKLLKGAPDNRLLVSDIPKFFTMLPDMRTYREVVSFLGPKEAADALVAINDVVAADEGLVGSTSLRAAKETAVFKQAFLRSSEAFFAWANAGPILRGLEYEEFGQISGDFNIHFQLDGRPNEHELSFRFDIKDDILPKRFVVLIGKNGVGKSQALGSIARAALEGGQEMTDARGGRPSLNRLLAFSPTSTSSTVFPTERRRSSRVWYRRFALANLGGMRVRHTTSELIMQLARSDEQIRANKRFNLFINAIRAIDDWRELGLRTANLSEPDVLLEDLQSGGEQARIMRFGSIDLRREPVRVINGRPFPLSSGEHSFLRFAAIASLHIENGTLVLLDEPETHLHPNFISQFVAVLNNLLEQTGSVAIIATHSVYFVREAFEDQVIVLRSEVDRTIRVERPTLKTFGADVGAISYFVFGEDEPSRLAKQVEDRVANGSLSWSEIFENYKDELSLELLGEIRSRIEPQTPIRSK